MSHQDLGLIFFYFSFVLQLLKNDSLPQNHPKPRMTATSDATTVLANPGGRGSAHPDSICFVLFIS